MGTVPTVVRLIVPLFAPLCPLLTASCRSLSSGAVYYAVVLRTWMQFVASDKPSGTPFLVAVVYVPGPRSLMFFSSEEIDSCLNVMSDIIAKGEEGACV